jgi:hypothetical protein
MNIRHRPHVHLPDNEENNSKNASSKAQKTEIVGEQNQISELSEQEKFDEIRRHEQLEKKCESQESHHKQFNDEDQKALREQEKAKLLRDQDQYKKLSEDDNDQNNKKNKKKLHFIDDERENEAVLFRKVKRNREKIKTIKALRVKKRASLLRG